MYIEVMSLCDAATEAQGKLNILGTFDTIFSQKLPDNIPHKIKTIILHDNY